MLRRDRSLLALVLAIGLAPVALAQDDAQVARLFEQACAACHVVPDAKYPTDKAWLGQLSKTA